MTGNPGTLGLGAVAATLAMVLQVQCTGVSAGVCWKVCAGAVGTAGVGVGGNIPLVYGVPVAPAWQASVGACLSVATFLAPLWGSCRFLFAWTCKTATEDASALMLFRIWSGLPNPVLGVSCPASSSGKSCASSSSSSSS